jgi:squalene-hopene/tetraprenyl-beta-curcumene cyclase
MDINTDQLKQTLAGVTKRLCEFRTGKDHWKGELSASALSTATAVYALATVDSEKYKTLIERGLDWIADNRNGDGGWGDTIYNSSNISTTMLCWAAFTAAKKPDRYERTVAGAESWLKKTAGQLQPEALVKAVNDKYGKDRTFAVPILTMCALAGKLGRDKDPWRMIKPLSFELAACPHWFFKWLKLDVVSYALPALIAIGQVSYHHRKPVNPISGIIRHLTRRKTLKVLADIQPSNGGFLEAAPLTSFVVMSLAAAGQKDNKVVSKGSEFLAASVRDDGSWPIDTNLATWVTTLSINALALSPDFEKNLSEPERQKIQQWLLSQQYRTVHPYTHTAPGGWAWTNLPGAVPDADDTAGALIALTKLGLVDDSVTTAAANGVEWLLNLQNRDGGIPTFCRGWGKLPFDRSAPDLTAHAVAAWAIWLDDLPNAMQDRVNRAIDKALVYLQRIQNNDGSWAPLWFGNENSPDKKNRTYGTARVLTYLQQLPRRFTKTRSTIVSSGVEWLLSAQNPDSGWGGAKGVDSSIEETALAVDALAGLLNCMKIDTDWKKDLSAVAEAIEPAVCRAAAQLIERLKDRQLEPSPIGLYFAKLWYYEKLYPWIFTAAALQKVQNLGHTT